MTVEILYLSGCPHHQTAVDTVRAVLGEAGVRGELTEIEINDWASAERLGFLGSPSIRVDGKDVEVAARSSRAFGLSCRTYAANGHRVGIPPADWVRAAILEAAEKS